MKKLLFILNFTALFALTANQIMAQAPGFKSKNNILTVKKNAERDTTITLTIKWMGDSVTATKAILKPESITSQSPDDIISALSATEFLFSRTYSNEYTTPIKFKKDTSSFTKMLRLILMDEADTELHYDTLTILYQKTVAETDVIQTLAKPIKELKNNIEDLKLQILQGDTTTSYLGKFIMKDTLISISATANETDNRSKPIDTSARITFKKERGFFDVKKNYSYDDFRINERKIRKSLDSLEQTKDRNRMIPISTKMHIDSLIEDRYLYYSLKKLKEVRLKISDGFIEYVSARTTDNTTFVYERSTSVVRFNDHLDEKAYSLNKDQFVFLGDILELDTYHYFNYFPDDEIYTLPDKAGKREAKLSARSGLGSLIDLRLYTDLLGTFGEQPNGLVQIEATSKLPTNARSIGRHAYVFNYVQPYFKLSKLDSKFDTVNVAPVEGHFAVNKMELFQRSFLNLGLKLNIFKGHWKPSNGFEFNLGYNFSSGNVNVGKDSVSKGNIHTPYGEATFTSKKVHNFGFEAEVKYGFQKLNKNKYFEGTGWNNIVGISTSMFFFPSKSQDKFFVRFTNYLSSMDRAEDFYQLQFGYSLNLRLSEAAKK